MERFKILNYDEFVKYINTEGFVKNLNEGLIRTYPITRYKDKLIDFLSNNKVKYELVIDSDNETFQITYYTTDIPKYDGLIQHCNMLGYFISRYKEISEESIEWNAYDDLSFFKYLNDRAKIGVILEFESKFDNIENVPDVIYHSTPNIYLQDILHSGIKPSSKSRIKKHPGRIYFSLNVLDCEKITKSLMFNDFKNFDFIKKNSHRNRPICDYTILEINTLETNTENIQFRKDPNSGGVYTYDYISPKIIKIHSTIISPYKTFYEEWLSINPIEKKNNFL